MAAFRSDEFAIDPARHPDAFLHFMEVFAPGSGNLSRILRIDNHKTASRAVTPSPNGHVHVAVGVRRAEPPLYGIWREPHDAAISATPICSTKFTVTQLVFQVFSDPRFRQAVAAEPR